MRRRSRILVAVVAALAIGVIAAGGGPSELAVSATAAALPALPPDIPSPPHVNLPKADQSATFNLVVEGNATDALVSRLENNAGACLIDEQGTVEEKTTYRRGKGVPIQFERFGKEIVMHRVGSEFDSTFGVEVTTERTATGGSTFTPGLPFVECPKPYKLAENKDCKKKFQSPGTMILSYEKQQFGLALSEKTAKSKPPKNECGTDPQTGVSSAFELAWPTGPKLETSPGLTPKAIFGHKQSIEFLLRSSDVGHRETRERAPDYGPFHGTETESAFNEATVHLIRLPGA